MSGAARFELLVEVLATRPAGNRGQTPRPLPPRTQGWAEPIYSGAMLMLFTADNGARVVVSREKLRPIAAP